MRDPGWLGWGRYAETTVSCEIEELSSSWAISCGIPRFVFQVEISQDEASSILLDFQLTSRYGVLFKLLDGKIRQRGQGIEGRQSL
ncbi:hypothetical protein TNCT_294071 [Trichonephila clavata]|uniref:Uncharacterized protein n=1 Tax=Trichonephila clavata TaxID=2740835 RepID=A0A8X6KN42_TRICU|nr:hypothetical protein TNCT_294071 [Trichonephila clavata]